MERHCLRVHHIAVRLADQRGWAGDSEVIVVAAILHDVGLYPSASRGGVYTADGAEFARELLHRHGWEEDRVERCAVADVAATFAASWFRNPGRKNAVLAEWTTCWPVPARLDRQAGRRWGRRCLDAVWPASWLVRVSPSAARTAADAAPDLPAPVSTEPSEERAAR